MDRVSGSAAPSLPGRAAMARLLFGALTLATIAAPVLAQSNVTPGSTINGTVPTSEGNIWNGLDHQPTPSDVAPITNPREQAQVNHTLSTLDDQLLNQKLPKVPAGAPQVDGNGN